MTICNHQNTALFSILQITYGGDGNTTFGLPNLKGRAPIGAGQGFELTERFAGDSGGSASIALQTGELASHTHTLNGQSASGDEFLPAPDLEFAATGELKPIYTATAATGTMINVSGSAAISNSGSGVAHNNMQLSLGLFFIVALQGAFPPGV